MPTARGSVSTPLPRGRFIPAARVGERIYSRAKEEDEEMDEEEVQAGSSEAPLTKSGFPDRRYKGFRDAPLPEHANPEYRRARTGGTVGDTHVTIDGRPDRRFKENRSLSDDEVMKQFAEKLALEYGIIKH